MLDYACRDDYGAVSADTSAWAGLHYFAAREPDDPGPLTWPEGNGWITAKLLERVGEMVRTGSVVSRIARDGTRWRVTTPRVAWLADAVIVAAPLFVAARLIEGLGRPTDIAYSPWVTANLTLDRWPAERGVPPAWDNVIFDSPGLGYVVATHQSMRQVHSADRLDVLLGSRRRIARREPALAARAGLGDPSRPHPRRPLASAPRYR